MSGSGRDHLARKLLEVLGSSGRPYTTLELAKAVGLVTRKEVNPTLYALQKQKKILQVTPQPPTWQLASIDTALGRGPGSTRASHEIGSRWSPSPTSRAVTSAGAWSAGRGQSEIAQPPPAAYNPNPVLHGGPSCSILPSHTPSIPSSLGNDDETSQVVQVLRGSSKPVTALEISKALGSNRKAANQLLYQMEAARIVVKTEGGGPPRWSLTSQREDDFIRAQTQYQEVQERRFSGTQNLPSGRSVVCEAADIDEEMPPLIFEGSPMETGRLLKEGGESGMETDGASPYSSTASVDLSVIPSNDIHGRLLAVMRSDPSIVRTDLELAKAIGEGYARSQVRPCLQELAQRGDIQMLQTFPPKWCLVGSTHGGSQSGLQSDKELAGGVEIGAGSHRNQQPAFPVATIPRNNSSTTTLANITEMNRNPVSALSEHCQAIKANLSFTEVREYGPPHRKHFVIAAKFGNHSFEAESTNKKEAKRMAADLALQAVRADQTTLPPEARATPSINPGPNEGRSPVPQANRFADHIASMSQDFYLQIQRTIEVPQPGRKVIAAFIMEDTATNQLSVVSVGTGTRCVTGDKMSLEGLVVNDSHAEVVARRSLLRFFYKQLAIHHQSNDETIFTKSAKSPFLAKLRENLEFHLYISTAPCGDGAQFSREDEQNRDPPPDPTHRPTMLTKVQGVLRTKMEGGEGTIPIADAQPQTWDGIIRGERLRTMSCSDKLGRWNVLGLQGSLLSNFLEPVYMSSLTLGSLHHHGHLARAICCRFSELERDSLLPPGFRVNHPGLDRVHGGDQMKRHTEKTSNLSMNWAHGDERAELNDGGNGKPVPAPGLLRSQLSTTCSRISKISLYSEFIRLCRAANRSDLLNAKTYSEAKELAGDFQRAKRSLFKVCENKGYGMWMKKPVEQEQFDSSVLEHVRLNT